MSLRAPLGRALGHGSAKEGVSHWWLQRVTAVCRSGATYTLSVAPRKRCLIARPNAS